MGLLEELKRRRVFRVTLAYVVAAAAVLQGADALFPALHLPPWTVTLVAILVVLGFPVALLLGWAFDVTPHGIARAPRSFRFPTRVAAVATVVLALLVTSFVALRRRAVASHLDTNAVAILPFRVNGDASLAAMREGMMDLLAVKLTGEAGEPRAIDSRTTISAWRRRVSDEKDDLPTSDAIALARKLRAGQVLLGEVVGTPGHVAVSVTLHSSVDGRTLARAQDTATADRLLPLVDRVVAQLLSQQAGQGRRAEALLSESLPAVRAYLDGQRLLRRGEYELAMQRFSTALEQDSTFALAGVGLAQAGAWVERKGQGRRGRAVALKYRARLPAPDREFIDVAFGYPESKPAIEQVGTVRDMVARAPDRIEAWHYLGELYYHFGSLIGIDNANDKALEAWKHALALDSTYMPVIEHQFGIYAERGDTANLRRVSDLAKLRLRGWNSMNGWVTATALHDAGWLNALRAGTDSASTLDLDYAPVLLCEAGLPQRDINLLIAKAAQRHQANNEPASTVSALLLANIGRPAAAAALVKDDEPDLRDFVRLWMGLVHAEADAPELAGIAQRYASGRNPWYAFIGGEYCLSHRDIACAQKGLALIRGIEAHMPLVPEEKQGLKTRLQLVAISAAMLNANIKAATRAQDARGTLQHADSMLLNNRLAPEVLAGPAALFALASVRAHLTLGDAAGAYAAAKGGANLTGNFGAGTPLLLEYARAATRLGKRDEAIAAYRRYLTLRQQAEPGALPVVEQARHELALLTAEPRK